MKQPSRFKDEVEVDGATINHECTTKITKEAANREQDGIDINEFFVKAQKFCKDGEIEHLAKFGLIRKAIMSDRLCSYGKLIHTKSQEQEADHEKTISNKIEYVIRSQNIKQQIKLVRTSKKICQK